MRVIEREGLVAALVSSAVSEERFVAAYEASLGAENADDSNASRQRVNALKKALGDLHAECGAFAAVAFDVSAGRVLAARTANAAPLHYGFTQDGALVACGGLTARRLFPDAGDAALRLTPLPSGRFVFGHRFVKPIEFTRFWDTAAANRAAAPARDASSVLDAIDRGATVSTVGAERARRRWGATGSAADGERRWTGVEQVPSVTPSTLHRAPSAGAYVPPSLRKKREAEAKLTSVYNSHRQQLERLQQEIAAKKSEQSEVMQQMNRWRTQWEEEMAEKNAVAAELLTLRSEFEKSSGTYDKEIEGLKDMLERTRAASAEMRDRWEESVTRKNALLASLVGEPRVRSIVSLGNSQLGRPIEKIELTDSSVPDGQKERIWIHA